MLVTVDAMEDSYLTSAIECPITMEIMKDPVIATDGHTYGRHHHLSLSHTSNSISEVWDYDYF